MNKLSKIAGASVLVLSIAACSGASDAPESEEVSETRMDDVDVIDGTISDDMVDVDAQASGDKLAEGEEAVDASDENGTEESAEEESE